MTLESLDEWCREWGYDPQKPPLLVRRLRRGLGDDGKVLNVLNVIQSACPTCRNNDVGCQCWNDN